MIWSPVPESTSEDQRFILNFYPDLLDDQPYLRPILIRSLSRLDPRCSDERDLLRAFKLAAEHKEPGWIVMFRDGKFCAFCHDFYDPESKQVFYTHALFNAAPCPIGSPRLHALCTVELDNRVAGVVCIAYARGKLYPIDEYYSELSTAVDRLDLLDFF